MDITTLESIKVWSQFGHPLLMWILLGITVYALYLGIQLRRTRTTDKETRKRLIKKDFRNRHYQIGSLLLALMILGTIGAMGVTYVNNGKLFVAPHLLVGLVMTGLIATGAALVPLMQKGQEWARLTHITLNVILLGLFGWQTISGMDILQRIMSRM